MRLIRSVGLAGLVAAAVLALPVPASASADPGPGWSEVAGGGATPSAPAPAVFPGQEYLFIRGTNNLVYLNRGNGSTFNGYTEVPGGFTTIDASGRIFVRRLTV